jgi:hypothetical protein
MGMKKKTRISGCLLPINADFGQLGGAQQKRATFSIKLQHIWNPKQPEANRCFMIGVKISFING